jgi:hypothetical protein
MGLAAAGSAADGGRMDISWRKDVDAALAEGRSGGRPLLIDFNAAPL